MGSRSESYSNFRFYDCFTADVTGDAAGAENGNTIDLQGYDTATIVLNMASLASGGAMNAADYWLVILQHGLDDGASGVSTWSTVDMSQVIHSVEGGYDSTATDGVVLSIGSNTDLTAISNIAKIGYKKDATHRFLRVKISNIDGASAMWIAGVAILGLAGEWPINQSV